MSCTIQATSASVARCVQGSNAVAAILIALLLGVQAPAHGAEETVATAAADSYWSDVRGGSGASGHYALGLLGYSIDGLDGHEPVSPFFGASIDCGARLTTGAMIHDLEFSLFSFSGLPFSRLSIGVNTRWRFGSDDLFGVLSWTGSLDTFLELMRTSNNMMFSLWRWRGGLGAGTWLGPGVSFEVTFTAGATERPLAAMEVEQRWLVGLDLLLSFGGEELRMVYMAEFEHGLGPHPYVFLYFRWFVRNL